MFNTPHLANISRPETLRYDYRRIGPAGFTDIIAMRIQKINNDGSKDVAFDYLTGPHRSFFPDIDHFHGNPLLMLALERDVAAMSDAIGVSKALLRNRIRDSFFDGATVADGTVILEGKALPARVVTIRPFEHERRFERIPSLQSKTYVFVLADQIPGMIDEIRIETPEDKALQAPALTEQMIFAGVEP